MSSTPSQTTGPFFPAEFIRPGDDDLTIGRDGLPIPGEPVVIEGTVVDCDGAPVENAIVELWQVDGAGRPAEATGQFKGWGRTWTDRRGCYRIRTIKPGPYRLPGPAGWVRPPVFGIMVLGSGLMRPLVTEAFFPNEPLNRSDRQLQAIADERARSRLILEPGSEGGHFVFEIRLRGGDETPFLIE
jgi:protocatechuate 3,4-dioxygenase beta subunit